MLSTIGHSPLALSPRAAYVHVPFCAHRCGYCNFTLVARRDDLIPAYLEAIERELALLGEPREVDTLFLGGGTPTQLPPAMLRQLLAAVRRWFPLSPSGELSIEANPQDLDDERIEVLAAGGVNRVSVGAQSFHAAKLRLLERDHSREKIVEAVDRLRPAIDNVSLDLIFGAPAETVEAWQADLTAAIDLRPTHLSTYGLTYERGTSFWTRRLHGDLHALDEETERALYARAIDTLRGAGYEHYEVSNFAQPGRRCRHNEAYWAGQEYFAVGPGAARYVAGRREVNHRSTTTWLRRVMAGESPAAEWEELSAEDRAREGLVVGLRRMAGVERAVFEARFGHAIDELVGIELRKFVELGLLDDDGRTIKLTRQGLFVSDSIWPRFLRR